MKKQRTGNNYKRRSFSIHALHLIQLHEKG
jgi:hypothetical protein